MSCAQKFDAELPNYGRNLPLPGQTAADSDSMETHMLSGEFLVSELSKDAELLDVDSKELLTDPSKDELLPAASKGTQFLVLENGDIINKLHGAIDKSPCDDGGGDSAPGPSSREPIRVTKEAHHITTVSQYFKSCQVRMLFGLGISLVRYGLLLNPSSIVLGCICFNILYCK